MHTWMLATERETDLHFRLASAVSSSVVRDFVTR